MLKTYQSFKELADEMTNGEGTLHLFNCFANSGKFYDDPCLAWQAGVHIFGDWLDYLGLKVSMPDDAKDFYDFMSDYYV